ncbi:MAG TPA: glycosyltransferase [Phenylobacterium sp.]|nr:glycosyltransferase [Phenylobacterium sp.]
MARIVYLLLSHGGIRGGHKMILRHVEALRELGFDAVAQTSPDYAVPTWLDHRAPIRISADTEPGDIIVIPDDATPIVADAARVGTRCVLFAQGFSTYTSGALAAIDAFPQDQRPPHMAVGPMLARIVGRLFPSASVDVVPCFADERIFRPVGEPRYGLSLTPAKRPLEADLIRGFFRRFYPDRADLRWTVVDGAREPDVARAFAERALHLALPKAESVGITTLEAMAAGAVCAGFLGVGGREYATEDNGFWAPDDDCEAAADALLRADDVVRSAGPALARLREASRATARQWSRAAFLAPLEAFWMRHAPEARLRSGPLDA